MDTENQKRLERIRIDQKKVEQTREKQNRLDISRIDQREVEWIREKQNYRLKKSIEQARDMQKTREIRQNRLQRRRIDYIEVEQTSEN